MPHHLQPRSSRWVQGPVPANVRQPVVPLLRPPKTLESGSPPTSYREQQHVALTDQLFGSWLIKDDPSR